MNTHTPGPWLYDINKSCTMGLIVAPDGSTIVELSALENSTAQADLESNARLIAAAPDLLYALRLMLREHDALQIAENRTDDRWPAATLARNLVDRLEP